MVNSMKQTSLTVAIMFFLASPASVLAEEQVTVTEEQLVAAEEQVAVESASETVVLETVVSETLVAETETVTPENTAIPQPQQASGMMHKGGGQHGKGKGCKKHGGGQQGKGQQGMHGKHEQVVRRLDMIEARMAKIEAMLESLMKR
jgi:hypothetical protein